ncbi:ribonuclease H-like domain-containing protein [Tanacetum coccineum]|uniref:Ribonuclease H-like domain-containing protein n=1 Tax=Tanacetum coccineum TaxID=301880 RepID=A0ABQ5BA66_9ASTR
MWLFRHKYLADGTLGRYKDRLVANGSTQLEVQQVCLYLHDPRKPHFSAFKRIFRYMRIRLVAILLGDRLQVTVYFLAITYSIGPLSVNWRFLVLVQRQSIMLSSATLVYCDNVSAVYLSSNLVQHQRTKHIEIDIHFVRDLVAPGQVRVLHVPSRYQYADIFTKDLPSTLFEEFRTSLSVRCPPAPTARECYPVFMFIYLYWAQARI